MRLNIEDPFYQTMAFAVLLIVAIAWSARKLIRKELFATHLTAELKGVAILMVIFSHIGYFLDLNQRFLYPLSVLGGVGVNLFLFLSGFGLTASALTSPKKTIWELPKRIKRLYLPLWLVVAGLLLADYLLLGVVYSQTTISQIFLGFYPRADIFEDFNSSLWFITWIVFLYIIFSLTFIKKVPLLSAAIVFLASHLVTTLLLPVSPDVLKLYKLHTLAFPIGMVFAAVVQALPNLTIWPGLKKIIKTVKILLIPVLLVAFAYMAIYSGVGEGLDKEQFVSLLTMGSLVVVFILKNYRFRLLEVLGNYSYEIYLFHWPLLYRFDIIYQYLPPFLATIIYLALFILIGALVQKLTTVLDKNLAKRLVG